MGKRGPAPTPKAMLKRRGSWRGELNPDEPEIEACRPDAPDWLGEHATAEWNYIVEILANVGVMTRGDVNALGRYCTMMARWKILNSATDMDSYPKELQTLNDQILKLEQQFGLTPSARSRITVAKPKDKKKDEKPPPRSLKLALA